MRPITQICNLKNCTLRIQDLTQDSNQYIKENIPFFECGDVTELGTIYMQKNRYKYSDTVTIDIIVKVTTTTQEILTTLVSSHTYLNKDGSLQITHLDENYYQPQSDGYYQIYHLILPVFNEDFIDGDNFKKLLQDEFIYYSAAYDENLVTFYKYYWDSENEKVIKEIISTEDIIQVCDISKDVLDTFVVCKLIDCYISLSKSVLNNCSFRCMQDNDEDATFKRDFIWMTLNVIKYLVEREDYLEAQRILEKVNSCGGFCGTTSSSSSSGCNCGKSSSYYSTTSYASTGCGCHQETLDCGCNKTVKKSSGCGCNK